MTEGEVSEALQMAVLKQLPHPVLRSGQRVGHLGLEVRSVVGHDYTGTRTPLNGPSIQSARNAGPFSSTPRFRCSAITLQVCVASGTATTSTRLANATLAHLNQDLLTKGFKTSQLQEIEEANRAAVLDDPTRPIQGRTRPRPPSSRGTGPGHGSRKSDNDTAKMALWNSWWTKHCTPCPKSFQATLIPYYIMMSAADSVGSSERLQHWLRNSRRRVPSTPPSKKLSSWAAPWA